MDTKLIKQFGEEILSYRLRSARDKKRKQHEDIEKKLIRLYKKERALSKTIWNLGWEPLIPPVQKGWVRHFVLRHDVASSKQAEFFEGILKKINTYEYSWRKDFKKKKRKFGKKVYVERPQYLLKPCEYHFKKLNFSDKEKQMFHEEWKMNYSKQWVRRFVFNEPWRFVLKVKTNMIDKKRIIDSLLESELKEIRSYLERKNLRHRQGKLVHGYSRWRDWKEFEKPMERNLFKNKSLSQIMDLINQ